MKKVLVISAISVLVLAGLLISTAIAAEEEEENFDEMMEEMAHQRELMEQNLHTLEIMSRTTFCPKSAAMVSLGALRDEMDMEPNDRIQVFENLLKRTRHLGVRNTIRMSLKDLYLETDQKKKAVMLLMEMVFENDEMLMIYEERRGEEEGEDEDEGEEEEGEEGEEEEDDDF